MPAKDELLLPEWATEILRLRDEAESLARLTASITLSSGRVLHHALENDGEGTKVTQPPEKSSAPNPRTELRALPS